jgi:hypothetical protein
MSESRRTDTPSAATEPRKGLLGLPLRLPQLVLVAIVGVVVAALAGALTTRGSEVLRSRATLLVDQPTAIAAAPFEGVIQKLDRLRFKYGPLLSTKVMADPAVAAANVPRGHIVSMLATPRANSLLLDVFAETKSAQESRRLADAGAGEIVKYAQDEQDHLSLPADQRFAFIPVDPAANGVRVTKSTGRVLTVAIIAGLLGALATAAVLYSLRIGRSD